MKSVIFILYKSFKNARLGKLTLVVHPALDGLKFLME